MRPLSLNDTMGIARVSADYICKRIVSAVATVEEIAEPSSRLLVFRGVGDGFCYQREGQRHMKDCSERSLI